MAARRARHRLATAQPTAWVAAASAEAAAFTEVALFEAVEATAAEADSGEAGVDDDLHKCFTANRGVALTA